MRRYQECGGDFLARRPLDTAPLGLPPRRIDICRRQVDLVRRALGDRTLHRPILDGQRLSLDWQAALRVQKTWVCVARQVRNINSDERSGISP